MTTLQEAFDAAQAHRQAGRRAEALTLYRLIQAQDPGEIIVARILAETLLEDGQAEAAAEAALVAMGLLDERDYAHLHLRLLRAKALRQAGRLAGAMIETRIALSLHPRDNLVFAQLRAVLETLGAAQRLNDRMRQATLRGAGLPPGLAVIIPCFNNHDTIVSAIESVRRSLHYCRVLNGFDVSAEIVIVDDGSTDGTGEIVARHIAGLAECRLVTNGTNRGAGFARNEGVRQSRGDYLLFLDADDYMLDAHILTCLRALEANPWAGWVDTQIISAEPLDPYWLRAIAAGVVYNLCIRRWCHDCFGGFMQHADFHGAFMEDGYYRFMALLCFTGLNSGARTILYCRRPGNTLDRYLDTFSRPPELGKGIPQIMPPADRARIGVLDQHFIAALNALIDRLLS